MPRVLLVEDDPDLRAMVEVRLRRIGHLVLSVGSGREALEVLAGRGVPDVLVLDVLMPGMSGLELLTTLRQDPAYAGLPAVFLSGRILPSDIEAGRALGATYLTKPVVITALAAAIEQSLSVAAAAADGSW